MKDQLIAWMADTSVAQFMTSWPWAWPWAEAIHFVGMSLLFGPVMIMDLRLLGFFRKEIPLHAVHRLTLWGVLGFLLNAITGVAFFLKDAERYWPNRDFWFKMNCILLAGINFLVFWFVIRRQLVSVSDEGDVGPFAKLVGISSLALWVAVIYAGRLIPLYGQG